MTLTTPARWETRVHKTVVVGQWAALMVGVISDMARTAGHITSWIALGLATAYAVGTTLLPERRYTARFGVETVTLGGAAVLAIALTLTGGAGSAYLLLSMGPPILATLYGGFRAGVLTGLFSASLLVLITLAQAAPLAGATPGGALYLVFVLLVGVIRKLLEDIHHHAAELQLEAESATQQLERLEQIHGALLRLSEDSSAGRLNAVEVAADTLDLILHRHPGSSGRLVIDGDTGPVVLSARGIPKDNGQFYRVPLSTAESTMGTLELVTPGTLSPSDLDEVAEMVYPMSLALANLKLLEGIVGSAVTEERTRLARDMHDEIGPALASLGLAIDLAQMRTGTDREITSELQVLRSNVTKLVEDVRAAVADLRTAPGPTLTARIMHGTSGFGDGPPVVVDIEERRPPRPALIGDLTSIIIEATRNAHNHSKASKIVVSGQVDRAFGRCSVVDDGVGFDPEVQPEGHFGLIGMRERASKIGATINFEAKPGAGTLVTVEWGTK
jgi:signal transduction histidine kinase